MLTELLLANQQFIIGMIATIIVWLLVKWTGKTVDKTQIAAVLTIILDIIQDISNNPATKDLDNSSKKQLAVQEVVKRLPEKKINVVKKVFGSIGGAVEYVYHNRKWLFSAAGKLVKAVF